MDAAPSPLEFQVGLPPFRLEGGAALPHLHLAAWWWGPTSDLGVLDALGGRSPAGLPLRPKTPPALTSGPTFDPSVPTVLVVHALTGDARVGGRDGWWAPLVGPGRPLDPACTRVLCFNNLGSCYGSMGPTDSAWPSAQSPDVGRGRTLVPAPVTTWDQARAVLRALDALGLSRIDTVLGGSLGGMMVIALAALAPERFPHAVPIAGSAAASPWIIGFNHIGRQAILQDPDWRSNPRGLELARQLAQMTYRAEPGLSARQGRKMRPDDPEDGSLFTEVWQSGLPYAQESYLEHQGRKLVERFDAESYLVQLGAMDHHDVDRAPPAPTEHDRYALDTPWSGTARIRSRVDAVGIDTDALYPAAHMCDFANATGGRYHEIRSAHGHDGFLIEWAQLEAILRDAGAPFDGGSG